MINKKFLLTAAGCLLAAFFLRAQDTVSLASFGYAPGSRVNAVPYVAKAIEACRKKSSTVLVFPKGRYDFWPQYVAEKQYYESNTDVIPLRKCPILLEGINNCIVDFSGAELVFHDKMQPITIDHCNNIQIKNCSIDWDIPLTAEAQVIAVTDDYIDISIDVLQFPYVIEKGKLFFVGEGWKSQLWDWGVMEFEKDTKFIAAKTGDESALGDYSKYVATDLQYGLVRLSNHFTRKPALGNYLVLRHSGRDHAGAFVVDSKNVSFENINLYQTGGLGMLAQYSENLLFKNVNVVPNAAKKRILSGHDDGLHISNCKGQLTVDGCKFLALMDDPINVHGTSVQIVEKLSDKKLLCKFMHEQSIGFTWAVKDDVVGFIENDAMNTVATGKVASFKARDAVFFEVEFEQPIPASITKTDALENLTWTPDVEIKNSFFGSNRARGILMTTPGKVIIENNVFESSGSAILISGDANGWFESGAVKDVTIRNNVFNAPCMSSMYQFCEAIISVYPVIPKPDINKPFHQNIRIESNTFHPFDYPVLYVLSTEGLIFNNNTIIRSKMYQPFHHRKQMLTFESCKKIQVMGNKLDGDVLGKNIELSGTRLSELKLDKKQQLGVSVK